MQRETLVAAPSRRRFGRTCQARREGARHGAPAEAVVLAAGSGTRLGTGRPKCLVDIGGRPLILRQLDALRAAGVESVVVVVGFEHQQIRDAVGDGVRYVLNERYAETNSLYSFVRGAELLTGGAFVLNADVLFDEEMLRGLCALGRSAFAFDSGSGAEAEHMKVHLRDGRLVEMRKDLAAEHCGGENVGVMRLGYHAIADARAAGHRLLDRPGGESAWLASAINRVAWRHQIAGLDVAGLPWAEIDFPDDLEHVRSFVWPTIAAARAPDLVAAQAA